MPQMGRILAKHGFKCTVLFSLNDKGESTAGGHLANPAALDSADAIVMSLRFRLARRACRSSRTPSCAASR